MMLELLAEPDLVERARHEPDAFAELYRRHRQAVHRFALSRLRNQADAEDVASEVFLRALVAIGRYQDRGLPFSAWLLRIAANVIVDERRRRRPVEDVDGHRDLAVRGSLEELVAERDLVRRIGLAAGPLPAGQRQALALRLGQDLAVAEVGRRMGRSEGAVKLLLHRAVRGVRESARAAGVLELAS